MYSGRWFSLYSKPPNDEIVRGENSGPPYRELDLVGFEEELESFAICRKRTSINKRTTLSVTIDSPSMMQLICCALNMNGYCYNGVIYVLQNGKWLSSKEKDTLSSIIT